MSEIVLSAFLSVIFEKLASATLEKLAPYNEINSEIKTLQRSLFQIQVLLTDASEKEAANQYVKRWLNGLQHLAYDIDDILDDLATEAMHRELTDESEAHTSKVRKFFSNPFSKHSLRTRMMKEKINEITTKLHDLIEEKAILGLIVKEETRSNRRLQTSMVHASSIVGRQSEKEALVHQLLLGGESSNQNFSIVPIVGMGGVGKTTLARLLYDDEQVDSHFKLKAWACVSDEFDSFAISKVIFQSVTGVNMDFADLNLLQVALRGHLRGKRFLLVLDDVWSESCEDWEMLVGPFHACAPGSKIIMTTRKDKLLRKLGCNNLNELKSVSHEDALSLFAIHSLGVNNFESHLSLKPLGEGIVKKCDGLPLALKALGRLLSTKKDEEYWKKVLDSEIWNLPVEGEIIPALKLSYLDLSACLKQLFAYCSLFPKDYMFDKEELVLLWMGEGFLHESPPRDATEESIGHEYFNELLSRSFFQHAPNNESLFVMHDMINDLATYVAGEFFVRLDSETKKETGKEMLENFRHMSFVREQFVSHKKLEAFKKSKSLRTFLATSIGEVDSRIPFFLSNNVMVDLLPELPLLRVICLSGFKVEEIPESIGTLRHLRYLNLSRASIRHLPEIVCSLNNLQTLILAGCRVLAKLPDNFFKLKRMRHLDIRDTPLLKNLPLGLHELKNLQTLSKIIIGGESGFEIARLKDFQNLRGNISIVGLDIVQNAIHVREFHVSHMNLTALEVTWTDLWDGSRNEMLENDVLNELKPCHDKLMQLKIRLYGGLVFPNWVGDPSFIHLKHVSVLDCKKCTSLPPLGQLPSLKELFIEGFDGVEVIGLELLGTGIAFRSLEVLSFAHMSRWKKWSINIGVVFPCLQELLVTDCPNLSQVLLETLPSLKVLKLERCDSNVLRSLVAVASSVTKMEIKSISGLIDVVWKGVIEYLRALEDLKIWDCNEIRLLWEPEATIILVSLRKLQVWDCDNLEHCICLDRIETFDIVDCTSVTVISFPMKGEKLKSLFIDGCSKLLETEWGGNSMPLLEVVWLKGYRTLMSITELNYLAHLVQLCIHGCENLESFPISELPYLTSLKRLRILNCPSLDACFPCGDWPPNLRSLEIGKLKKPISEWGPQNFPPSLVHLHLYGEDGVSSFSHLSHLLPPYLTHLRIENFEKLESVTMGLQHLTSLQHLTFINCPNMMHLPRMLLPSLLGLRIFSCPKLEERCRKGGYYWNLISHIPQIAVS